MLLCLALISIANSYKYKVIGSPLEKNAPTMILSALVQLAPPCIIRVHSNQCAAGREVGRDGKVVEELKMEPGLQLRLPR